MNRLKKWLNGAVRYHRNVSVNEYVRTKNILNNVFSIQDVAATVSHEDYLPGTTFWINEFMHVGHVFYDIALMEVVHIKKIDRIILQRSACHDRLFQGVLWYKAADQLHVPVYLQHDRNGGFVNLMYYSENSAIWIKRK